MAEAGVLEDSIVSQGLGESQPIDSNDTIKGRERNRRVEIIIQEDFTPISQR
jgi:outer membrane protein OmpA-like peptidoglycan-associated protein